MLTGRVGMTFDRMLLYVTGGGAWVRDEFELRRCRRGTSSSAKQNRDGWTIGAGLEYGIVAELVDCRAVQLHRSRRQGRLVPAGGFTASAEQDLHLATVRLNYRFGGGAPFLARY